MELFISNEYKCRPDSRVVRGRGMQQSYVVSPPLPDDVTEFGFCFAIKSEPHRQVPERKAITLKELSVTIK